MRVSFGQPVLAITCSLDLEDLKQFQCLHALLTTDYAFELWRRYLDFAQQCYLHHFHAVK